MLSIATPMYRQNFRQLKFLHSHLGSPHQEGIRDPGYAPEHPRPADEKERQRIEKQRRPRQRRSQ